MSDSTVPTLGIKVAQGEVIAFAEYPDDRFVVLVFLNSLFRESGQNYGVGYWTNGTVYGVTEHRNIVNATADYDERI